MPKTTSKSAAITIKGAVVSGSVDITLIVEDWLAMAALARIYEFPNGIRKGLPPAIARELAGYDDSPEGDVGQGQRRIRRTRTKKKPKTATSLKKTAGADDPAAKNQRGGSVQAS